MADQLVIEEMTPAHADGVLAVYQAGLDTGIASFDTAAPDWATWDAAHLPEHRLVAVEDTPAGPTVRGWVALSAVSSRCVYAGVAEVSVYVDPRVSGRGVGTALLERVIASSEAAGIWTLQSGVFPDNDASRRLHAKAGFREVGRRERHGQRDGVWRDVLLLERRSATVGT